MRPPDLTPEKALARVALFAAEGYLPRDRATWLRLWLAAAMDAGLPPPHLYGAADPGDVALEWGVPATRWSASVTLEGPDPWPQAYVWVSNLADGRESELYDATVPVAEGFTGLLIALLAALEVEP